MLTLGRIVAALLSGALLAQAYGLTPFWPLAWIAPIPLLIAAIGATRLGAFLYGAIAGALSVGGLFLYLLELAGPVTVAVIVLITALEWGAIAFAVRGAARHLPKWAAVFVFPALLASVETLIGATSPHGVADSLAHSQMNFIPAIQVAALGGSQAITFVLALFASAIAFLLAKRAFAAAVAPALIVVAALGWGVLRVPPPANGTTQVALIASDLYDIEAADWRPALEAYAAAAERAAYEGARIIVLPEKIVILRGHHDAQEATQLFQRVAAEYSALIVYGAVAIDGEQRFNRAYLVTGQGVQTYDKRHMVPGFESHLTVGDADLVTDWNGTPLGVAICKDFDFPALGRGYGARNAAIMLAPAWDFDTDWWLHSRMGMLRSVENGYAMLRSAKNGVMTVNDAYGRVTAQARSGDMAVLTAAIPLGSRVPTLYTQIGDAFGWACVVFAVLLIGWTVAARRRAGQGA